jgi:polyhydroxyalkanoate synthesis regulator phasin
MFTRPDDTYNNIRKRSLEQWLSEMENHEDVAVRGGVKLTREYIAHLEEEISRLKDECKLKDDYLKKMSKR